MGEMDAETGGGLSGAAARTGKLQKKEIKNKLEQGQLQP